MDEEPGKKWPERRRDHQASHRQGKRQAVGGAKLADEAAGIAGKRNEGLHPALRPAAALRQPGIEPGWCLFLRARWQNADMEAEAGETKAEIGIFGHVPGIPAADFAQNPGAKMIGRPAERQRQAKLSKARVQHIEQNGILNGEEPG